MVNGWWHKLMFNGWWHRRMVNGWWHKLMFNGWWHKRMVSGEWQSIQGVVIEDTHKHSVRRWWNVEDRRWWNVKVVAIPSPHNCIGGWWWHVHDGMGGATKVHMLCVVDGFHAVPC